MIRVAFVTILPSPYQLDLFRALSRQPEVDLTVFYLEEAAPDSPWPATLREPYEHVLKGFWIGKGPKRWHFNWPLPDVRPFDVVVVSTYTSAIGQWLMRRALKGKRWLFWGERMRAQSGIRARLQEMLTKPLHEASGIVGIGKLAHLDYGRRFPGVRQFNIPYYTELAPFLSIHRNGRLRKEGEVSFLCCGQMIRRKGIDVLLAAFERLVMAGLPVRLLLVGREAELPEMMAGIGNEARSRIEYRGFHAPDALPRDFADADVFVLPSRHDGWGVVVNQALGAGMPIVCSDAVGAAHDLIEPDVNGMMIETGNVDALEAVMKRLAEQPDLITRWGQASRDRAKLWSPEQGARAWVNVLESVISNIVTKDENSFC